MKNYRLLLGLLVILGACLIGCGGGGGGGGNNGGGNNGGNNGGTVSGSSGTGATNPTNPAVSQITIAPSTPSIMVGQSVTLTALGKDAANATVNVNPNNWLWTISDTSVATIAQAATDHATVTATKPGTLTVTVKEGRSGVTNSTTINVTAVPVQPGNGGPGSTIVYQNDFSAGADNKWSNQTISAIPNANVFTSRNFLGEFAAQTVSLTVDNLPAHGNVTVDFDLFIIRSMDGNATNPVQGPDVWSLTANGVPTPLVNTSFSNIVPNAALGFPEGYFQAYPGSYPGASFPYQTGATLTNKLGYVYAGAVLDAVYHITRKIPHSGGLLQLNFTSAQTQAIADESWGLKNVIISVSP